jgi:hypothetical protein
VLRAAEQLHHLHQTSQISFELVLAHHDAYEVVIFEFESGLQEN